MPDFDDYEPEDEDESEYCECGAVHDSTETDFNQCFCCGKVVK